MTTLQFADTHNLVAFLSKPTESEGFEQIVDFLNANPIRYALTINPTIYTSCIEQFWDTVKVKIVNVEVQLQALVDGKKVIITESTVRRNLHLEDAEGIDCLPNATIFEQLTLMGYEKVSQKLTFYKAFFFLQWKFLIHTILKYLSAKTTTWNEFSSTMASAIICLATNQKFNFSKYIFESMVKNLENVSGKFLIHAVNEEMDDSLERTATTTTSLDAEHDRGGGPRRQDTMRDTIAQTGFENVSKHSNDPLLARDEGLGEEDASKQERIDDIDANEDIYLVNVYKDEDMFGVNDREGDEVIVETEVDHEVVVETEVTSKDVNLSVDEVTLAQALAALKSAKPKADKVMLQEPEQCGSQTMIDSLACKVSVTLDKSKITMVETLCVY
ncbi:hypothetical protein Tco_1433428 [Tanacetum coccineum]